MVNNNKKTKIDTLIISDIHLGDKSCRAKELIETLNRYEFKRLILNGDIFDGLNFKRLHTMDWSVLSKIRKVSRQSEVVWIIGNHDGAAVYLSELVGVKVYNKYVWRVNGKKYLAIHGHQFDRFLSKNFIISAIAVSCYNLIKRIDTKNQALSHWIKERNKTWLRLSEQVARGAILYGRLLKADRVFCGHTHRPMHQQAGRIDYYNGGSWVETPSSYIAIKGGNVKIVSTS